MAPKYKEIFFKGIKLVFNEYGKDSCHRTINFIKDCNDQYNKYTKIIETRQTIEDMVKIKNYVKSDISKYQEKLDELKIRKSTWKTNITINFKN